MTCTSMASAEMTNLQLLVDLYRSFRVLISRVRYCMNCRCMVDVIVAHHVIIIHQKDPAEVLIPMRNEAEMRKKKRTC